MKEPIIKTSQATFEMRDDGICCMSLRPQAIIELKDVQENEALLGEHFGEERILFLVDMRNIQSMSKEARKYLSRSDIGLYATAVALLVRSPLSKFFGNLIMNFSKPHYPTKIFTSEQEAVLWLHQRSPTSQEDTA